MIESLPRAQHHSQTNSHGRKAYHRIFHATQHGNAVGSSRISLISSAAHPLLLQAIVSVLSKSILSRSHSASLSSSSTPIKAVGHQVSTNQRSACKGQKLSCNCPAGFQVEFSQTSYFNRVGPASRYQANESQLVDTQPLQVHEPIKSL